MDGSHVPEGLRDGAQRSSREAPIPQTCFHKNRDRSSRTAALTRYLVGRGAARGRRAAAGLVALQEGLAGDLGDVKFGAAVLGLAVFGLVVGDRLLVAESHRQAAFLGDAVIGEPLHDRQRALLRKLEVVGRLADVVGVPLDADAA